LTNVVFQLASSDQRKKMSTLLVQNSVLHGTVTSRMPLTDLS
jgi:hypothetical protein